MIPICLLLISRKDIAATGRDWNEDCRRETVEADMN